MKTRCDNCRFWDKDGRCHRHAPPANTPVAADHQSVLWYGDVAVWPKTDQNDWCGEFQPSPALDVQSETTEASSEDA